MLIPDNRTYIQCYRCATTEYFTCRMTCQGDVCVPTSDRAYELCQPPKTSVYLTYVGDELKIGVSLGIPRRWVEQGSDLATVVATAPGLEARRLEQYAAQQLNLKLQVRNSTKLQSLNSIDMEQGRQQLEKAIDDIQPLITEILGNVPGNTVRQPEIIDLHPYYGDLHISTPVQQVEVLPGNEFGGEIVGLKGSILVVKQGAYHYAMDLKKLRSYEFDFIDEKAKIATQSYLDQWF